MQKYEILRVIGEGAYGIVLECRNKESGRIVAVKKFKDGEENELSERSATMREVKILKSLDNVNIVHLMEAFKRKSKLYLVFEFVEQNLLELLESGDASGLKPDLIKKYTYQICQALNCCHEHGIVHRDVKPENLLVDSRTQVLKLCDFGFARLISGDEYDLTDYVATRWYRPPELLLGYTSYSFSVDTWAVGCIIGEMSDTNPLFPGDSEVDQLFLIQRCLGVLTMDQQDSFQRNPRFAGVKFPDMKSPESVMSRYSGKLVKKGIELIQQMLHMEPSNRISMRQCLTHPFFDGVGFTPRREVSPVANNEAIARPSRVEMKERDSGKSVASKDSYTEHDSDTRSVCESIGNATIDSFDMEPYGFKDESMDRTQFSSEILDYKPNSSFKEVDDVPFRLPAADSRQFNTPRMQLNDSDRKQSTIKLASISRSQFETKDVENAVHQSVSSKKSQISVLIEEARNHIRMAPEAILKDTQRMTSDARQAKESSLLWNTKQKMRSEDNIDLPRLQANEIDQRPLKDVSQKMNNSRIDRHTLADPPKQYKTPRNDQIPEVMQAASRVLMGGDLWQPHRANQDMKSARNQKDQESHPKRGDKQIKDHSVHFSEAKTSNVFLKPSNNLQVRQKHSEEANQHDDSDNFESRPNRSGRMQPPVESSDVTKRDGLSLSFEENDRNWRSTPRSLAISAAENFLHKGHQDTRAGLMRTTLTPIHVSNESDKKSVQPSTRQHQHHQKYLPRI